MAIIDWLFKEDKPVAFAFGDTALDLYQKQGAFNWLELYLGDKNAIHDEVKLPMQQILPGIEVGDKMSAGKIARNLESLLVNLKSEHLDLPRDAEVEILQRAIRIALIARCLKIGLWCKVKYGSSIPELVQASRKGDTAAFLKLVRLDSTFLASEFGGAILACSELKNDDKFRHQLSRSLAPRKGFWTLEGGRKNYRHAFALWFMSQIGFINRPYEEWANFLAQQGFDNFADDRNVAKACKRYKIPKKHPSTKR